MAERGARQLLGARGEDLAVKTLESVGMQVLARNWRCRWGEIDIVARDWSGGVSALVVVEVKTRRGLGYGSPTEAITHAKLRRLRRLAAEWILVEQTRADVVRVDVVGVLLRPGYAPEVTHLRGVGS